MTMTKRIKVKDLISPIKGFFSGMNFDFKVVTIEELDMYFFNFFSQKSISPFCDYWISDEHISDEKLQQLSMYIQKFYQKNWEKLLAMVELEYDPIHNFSDTLHEDIVGTDDDILTTSDILTKTGNGSFKRTDNLTSTETKDLVNHSDSVDTKNLSDVTTGQNDELIAGFNSSSYKNSEAEKLNTTVKTTGTDTVVVDGTNTGTDTTENTGTQITDETRNFQDLTEGKHVSDNDYTKKRDVTRIGNIGNITNQQMIQQEIELWRWNFIKTVLENVRDITTLAIYS